MTKRLLVSALLGFFCSSGASAQQDQGTITGLVTDGTGAALPGARVVAVAKDTGVLTTAVTNASGSFTLASLSPDFGTIGATVSTPRQLQFAAKLIF